MLLFTCRCLRTTLGDDKADRFLPPLLSIPPAVKQRDREGHRSTSSITVKIERRSPKPIEVLLINSISTFPWNNILNLSADENPEVLKVGIRRHLEPVLRSMPGEMDRTPRGAGRREQLQQSLWHKLWVCTPQLARDSEAGHARRTVCETCTSTSGVTVQCVCTCHSLRPTEGALPAPRPPVTPARSSRTGLLLLSWYLGPRAQIDSLLTSRELPVVHVPVPFFYTSRC